MVKAAKATRWGEGVAGELLDVQFKEIFMK
jgi:hypothetical protein